MNDRIRKNYFQITKKHQRRQKAQLKRKLEDVEKFANQIGLKISQILLKKNNNSMLNSTRNIDIIIKESDDNDLENLKKTKTLKCLMFKEKANISNAKYTKTKSILDFAKLPAFYQLNKLKSKIDLLTHLRYENKLGIYVDALQKITLACTLYLRKRRAKEPNFKPDKFILKIACDGTNITRSRVSVLNLSFTIINDRERCKTAFGNFILGNNLFLYWRTFVESLIDLFIKKNYKGIFQIEKENYSQLHEALKEISEELKVIENIQIEGHSYLIKKKWGGDLKSLSIIFGIVGSNGNHGCLWCHCNLSEPVKINENYPFKRTQELSNENSTEKKLGYTNKPIIDFIEYEDIIFDMLHLHLRITDKLFECLLQKLIDFDNDESIDA